MGPVTDAQKNPPRTAQGREGDGYPEEQKCDFVRVTGGVSSPSWRRRQ